MNGLSANRNRDWREKDVGRFVGFLATVQWPLLALFNSNPTRRPDTSKSMLLFAFVSSSSG
jgi:hypothetical protein